MIQGLLGGVLALLAYLAYQAKPKKKAHNIQTPDAFAVMVLTPAAEWLATRLNAKPTEVEQALIRAETSGARPALVRNVERIEAAVEKVGASRCRLHIAVAVREAHETVVGRITQEVGWESLPRHIRHEFIRKGESVQRFLVIEEQTNRKEN